MTESTQPCKTCGTCPTCGKPPFQWYPYWRSPYTPTYPYYVHYNGDPNTITSISSTTAVA